MEPVKRARGRSRSSLSDSKAGTEPSDETAPNLNGENDVNMNDNSEKITNDEPNKEASSAVDEETSNNELKETEKEEEKSETLDDSGSIKGSGKGKGRKRKASEMKDSDESIVDDSVKPVETENTDLASEDKSLIDSEDKAANRGTEPSDETASNLNGENDVNMSDSSEKVTNDEPTKEAPAAVDEETNKKEPKETEKEEEKSETLDDSGSSKGSEKVKGRKRKSSEMKGSDESIVEDSVKPVETENTDSASEEKCLIDYEGKTADRGTEPSGETAPNLKGENDENMNDNSEKITTDEPIKEAPPAVDEETSKNEPKETEIEEEKSETLDDSGSSKGSEKVKGRKRKASEMKGSDESVVEDSVKPVETENTDSASEEKNFIDYEDKTADRDESFNDSDLGLPLRETLGKGKRARIPNKRYSDIMLSPKHQNKSMENGTEKIESETESTPDVTPTDNNSPPQPVAAPPPPQKSRTSVSSPIQPSKKQKVSMDLSNPAYFKPFEQGWKRELVWRATNESNTKRNGDIYYYTPTGKKVRSMREVSENLRGKDLTLENFTFFKAPLGVDDPQKEIIRDAKYKAGSVLAKKMLAKVAKAKAAASSPKVASPKVVSPKLPTPKTPKPKTAKVSSPKVASPKVALTENAQTPTVKKTPARGNSKLTTTRVGKKLTNSGKAVPSEETQAPGFRIKLPQKNKREVKPKPEPKVEEQMEPAPPLAKSTPSKRKWPNSYTALQEQPSRDANSKPASQPCSIRCQGVQGVVPTLQCRLCLCLYHHECVGLATHLNLPYVCKNCHLAQDQPQTSQPSPAPPPLTPINTLKSAGGNQSTTTLPKLQRIPSDTDVPDRQDSSTPSSVRDTPPPEMPHLIPRPMPPLHAAPPPKILRTSECSTPTSESNKSLLGSVTTWLPHNSKIVDSIQRPDAATPTTEAPRPQYLEFLGGRKFLVIPKHNFMSVSPTVAATAGNKTSEDAVEETVEPPDSASLGPAAESDVKVEPDSPSKPENSQTSDAMEVDQTPASLDTPNVTNPDSCPEQAQETVEAEDGNDERSAPTPPKENKRKSILKPNNVTANSERERPEPVKFMDNYLQNLSYGYNTLLYVFQYLKVQDLLRAGCVCTMWRDIASHPLLWRTVRMKNSQVHSFEGLANTLKKHGTVHLDLRKMLLPSGGDGDEIWPQEIWPQFSKAIQRVDTLRKIELCRCPSSVVEQLAITNPNIEVINAVTIKSESMSLEPFTSLRNIKELRLKSTGGLTLSYLDSLKELKTLKHLSLTSIRDLNTMNLSVIAELTNLESLDLGECTDFPLEFGAEILTKLGNLEKLRLEKGQGNCYTFEILDAVKKMRRLEQLELVNFDIKAGFDKALGACINIKKLLIIPTYISQSATTNHMVLGGVLRLQKTLSHFVWGVTLELLRVTELFVDQCEDPEKKEEKAKKPPGNGDSIPVLKPVPLITGKEIDIPPAHDPPQVEILALPNLQKLLLQSLPTTRVKILKIPFHATWRQSITDSVN